MSYLAYRGVYYLMYLSNANNVVLHKAANMNHTKCDYQDFASCENDKKPIKIYHTPQQKLTQQWAKKLIESKRNPEGFENATWNDWQQKPRRPGCFFTTLNFNGKILYFLELEIVDAMII